jgi:hypothetical protein
LSYSLMVAAIWEQRIKGDQLICAK